MVTFEAEVKSASVKKLVSLDKEGRVILVTQDIDAIAQIMAIESDRMVKITIEEVS